jgi:hypothetical protein
MFAVQPAGQRLGLPVAKVGQPNVHVSTLPVRQIHKTLPVSNHVQSHCFRSSILSI